MAGERLPGDAAVNLLLDELVKLGARFEDHLGNDITPGVFIREEEGRTVVTIRVLGHGRRIVGFGEEARDGE